MILLTADNRVKEKYSWLARAVGLQPMPLDMIGHNHDASSSSPPNRVIDNS